jgi:PBP1b-binding outer membrane lipoprotein LpoB
MKYRIMITLSALLLCGCAAQETKAAKAANASRTIIDEEFDLLIAPEYAYDKDIPYEQQIMTAPKSGASPKKKDSKPARTAVEQK